MGNVFGVPTEWTLIEDSLDIFEKFFPLDSVAVTAYKNSKKPASNLKRKRIPTHLKFSCLIVRSINNQCMIQLMHNIPVSLRIRVFDRLKSKRNKMVV
jgi:hypothetical protein